MYKESIWSLSIYLWFNLVLTKIISSFSNKNNNNIVLDVLIQGTNKSLAFMMKYFLKKTFMMN